MGHGGSEEGRVGGDVDALIPRWLFVLEGRPIRFLVAVGVPALVTLPLILADEPVDLRLGPLLALGLIVVAAVTGATASAAAGVFAVVACWLYIVPPSGSFRVHGATGYVALGAMAALATGLPWLTRRIERAVSDVRDLDARRRAHVWQEAASRQEAEQTATRFQAILALSNSLADATSMREVAERLLDRVDQPAVPTTGSVAIVQDNRLSVLAARGAKPESLRALERIDLTTSQWLGAVLEGEPAFIDDREEFAARYPSARVLALYPSGSWLVVPFRSESTLGLLSLHYESPQPLTEHALYFSLVAEMLSSALDRARAVERQQHHHQALERAFAERDRIARTLSTTLLPPRLPALPGFSMAGWLVPASPDEVAGDFYDVFAVADGGWVAVLGDVCGKGAEAAAVTSLARYAARASALDDPDPLHVVEVANRALDQDPSDLFCTMAVVRYLPAADEVEVVLAGHLQARLVIGNTVRRVGRYGSPLGLMRKQPEAERHPFDPGSSVVLFSDGLVERNEVFGEDELDATLRTLSAFSAPHLALALQQRVLEIPATRKDDLAALVVNRSG